MYPQSIPIARSNRIETDSDPAAFWAGTQVTLQTGGTFSGGTLYDVLDILTAGATAQQSTVADEGQSDLGAPKDSVGYYKFTNPGTGTAKGIFSAWWEELPVS